MNELIGEAISLGFVLVFCLFLYLLALIMGKKEK